MKKKKKPKKKKPPIANPDPSGLKSTPNGGIGFDTTDAADRLNLYAPLKDNSFWRAKDFDVTTDRIGIYVGNTSQPESAAYLPAVFNGVGLPMNGAILPAQFKSISGSIGSFLSIDSSDRFIYNRATQTLSFDADGSGPQASIRLIVFGGDTPPLLSNRNLITFSDFSTAPGTNNLIGGPGNDVITGAAAADKLEGGAGDDTLSGGAGNDQSILFRGLLARAGLFGGSGNDLLKGEAGDDSLLGEIGNDILRGGTGLDILEGGFGDDRLNGEEDGDRLLGGEGNDLVQGGKGNDRMDGGEGNDTLIGGIGQDSLVGSTGNDILNGGKGNDIFILERGGGRDIIQDYKDDEDWLGLPQNPLRPGEFIRFNDLSIVQRGRDTVISIGTEELAILRGVRANQLRPSDFVPVSNFIANIPEISIIP